MKTETKERQIALLKTKIAAAETEIQQATNAGHKGNLETWRADRIIQDYSYAKGQYEAALRIWENLEADDETL